MGTETTHCRVGPQGSPCSTRWAACAAPHTRDKRRFFYHGRPGASGADRCHSPGGQSRGPGCRIAPIEQHTQIIGRYFRRHPPQQAPTAVGPRILASTTLPHGGTGRFDHLAGGTPPASLGTRRRVGQRADIGSVCGRPVCEPLLSPEAAIAQDGCVRRRPTTGQHGHPVRGRCHRGLVRLRGTRPVPPGPPARVLKRHSATQRSWTLPEARVHPVATPS